MTLTHILLFPEAVKTLERANTETLRLYMGTLSPTCVQPGLYGEGGATLLYFTQQPPKVPCLQSQSRKEVTPAHMPKPESEQLELHKPIVLKTTELSKNRPDRVRARPRPSSPMSEGPSPTPARQLQEGERKPDRKMAVAYVRGFVTSHIPPRVSPYSVDRQKRTATWDQYGFIRYI